MALPKVPETETSSVSETRKHLSEALDRVYRRETRLVVEKSGIPVGAIVSMDDLARLERIDRNRQDLMEILATTRQAFGGVPADEIEAEIEKAIAVVKAERRAQREETTQTAPRR